MNDLDYELMCLCELIIIIIKGQVVEQTLLPEKQSIYLTYSCNIMKTIKLICTKDKSVDIFVWVELILR